MLRAAKAAPPSRVCRSVRRPVTRMVQRSDEENTVWWLISRLNKLKRTGPRFPWLRGSSGCRQTSSQSKHQPSSLPNQSAAQHLLLRFCQRRASKPAACNFSLCSSRHQRLLVFYLMAGTSHSNSTELIELLMFSLLARSICML
uniref:Uncharacterized protein n=1 Tax=Setaria viridis TaxID=4556 RepID=A0A4U6SU72_SETVI|nr:hypothetical protein SEVIR_9G120400v2 [Setaria viridis]